MAAASSAAVTPPRVTPGDADLPYAFATTNMFQFSQDLLSIMSVENAAASASSPSAVASSQLLQRSRDRKRRARAPDSADEDIDDVSASAADRDTTISEMVGDGDGDGDGDCMNVDGADQVDDRDQIPSAAFFAVDPNEMHCDRERLENISQAVQLKEGVIRVTLPRHSLKPDVKATLVKIVLSAMSKHFVLYGSPQHVAMCTEKQMDTQSSTAILAFSVQQSHFKSVLVHEIQSTIVAIGKQSEGAAAAASDDGMNAAVALYESILSATNPASPMMQCAFILKAVLALWCSHPKNLAKKAWRSYFEENKTAKIRSQAKKPGSKIAKRNSGDAIGHGIKSPKKGYHYGIELSESSLRIVKGLKCDVDLAKEAVRYVNKVVVSRPAAGSGMIVPTDEANATASVASLAKRSSINAAFDVFLLNGATNSTAIMVQIYVRNLTDESALSFMQSAADSIAQTSFAAIKFIHRSTPRRPTAISLRMLLTEGAAPVNALMTTTPGIEDGKMRIYQTLNEALTSRTLNAGSINLNKGSYWVLKHSDDDDLVESIVVDVDLSMRALSCFECVINIRASPIIRYDPRVGLIIVFDAISRARSTTFIMQSFSGSVEFSGAGTDRQSFPIGDSSSPSEYVIPSREQIEKEKDKDGYRYNHCIVCFQVIPEMNADGARVSGYRQCDAPECGRFVCPMCISKVSAHCFFFNAKNRDRKGKNDGDLELLFQCPRCVFCHSLHCAKPPPSCSRGLKAANDQNFDDWRPYYHCSVCEVVFHDECGNSVPFCIYCSAVCDRISASANRSGAGGAAAKGRGNK